jgi:hypothetical protein
LNPSQGEQGHIVGHDVPYPQRVVALENVEKLSSQAVQKDLRGEAREKSTSGGVLSAVRWSEAIERNEAYDSFSTACLAATLSGLGTVPYRNDICMILRLPTVPQNCPQQRVTPAGHFVSSFTQNIL